MNELGLTIVLVNVAATLWMTGLIWFVQIVHYPLFSWTSPQQFAEFEIAHQKRTTLVVAPPMIVELMTALLLLAIPPAGFPRPIAWAGVLLVAIIWLSTLLIQVPQHARLAQGFDTSTHAALVRLNWMRTAAWSMRSILMMYGLAVV